MNKPHQIIIAIKTITSIIILLGGVKFCLWLKSSENLSEPSFITLIAFFMILSIVIPFFNQIQSFSLFKGELILKEMKETETSIKNLGIAIYNAIDCSSKDSLSISSASRNDFQVAMKKLKELTT